MPVLRIGILVLVLGLVACRHRVPQTVSRMPPAPATQTSPAAAPKPSVQTQLEALRRMHADGLITQQEYDAKRKKVLEGL